jgi:hypothetical protein
LVIDPEEHIRVPFMLALPNDAKFVRVKGTFEWSDETVHDASRLFLVPPLQVERDKS